MKSTIAITHIFEHMTTAVLALDANLRLNKINPAAEMLLAISARQAKHLKLVQLIPIPEFVQSVHQAQQTGQPFMKRELEIHLPNAPNITVCCVVTPLQDNATAPYSVIIELSAHGHLRFASEQQDILQKLLRNLAHEIKNPLGGLRGAAQLLERELPDSSLREYTHIIIEEADRLRKLLDRMLSPHHLPEKKRINIHQPLEHVYSLITSEISPKIVLKRDYDPSIPLIYADPDQLIQALLNIVRNAVQALGQAGGEILLRSRIKRQITINQQRYKLVAQIDILDNGPGIPENLQSQIFYPMVSGRVDGTGLGLSITQALIHRHNGVVECTSRPGCTLFTLLLPINGQEAP